MSKYSSTFFAAGGLYEDGEAFCIDFLFQIDENILN
jgi:hypothetical protein